MEIVMSTWQIILLTIGSSSLVSAVVTIILKSIFQKGINSHAERLKSDLQKEVINSQFVIEKRHKIIPNLYKLVMNADGAIRGLHGVGYEPTYEEWNEDDFEKAFDEMNVLGGMRTELHEILKSNREKGIKKWRQYKRMLEIHRARNALMEARNELLVSEIYLNPIIVDSLRELLKTLGHYLISIEHPRPLGEKDKKPSEWEKEIVEQVDASKMLLRDELKAKWDDFC